MNYIDISENIKIESLLQENLDASEKLIWWGKPKDGLNLNARDIIILPFAIAWLSVSIFWEYNLVKDGELHSFKIVMIIFGIPFVLIGLYILFGRLYEIFFIRSSTYYAVTSERILITTNLLKQKIKSIFYYQLEEIRLTEKSNMLGTINFIHKSNNKKSKNAPHYISVQNDFVDITNPKYVYKLILDEKDKLDES